jgi:hypothetical protein
MCAKLTAGCAYLGNSLEANWPSISSRERTWPKDEQPEIEPKEADEFSCDFFVDPSERFVFIYAYVHNEKKGKIRKRSLGWTTSAFHELSPPDRPGRLRRLLARGAR